MNVPHMRMSRLFDRTTGHGFVIAFDRGLGASALPAGRDALGVVDAATRSPADGVLLSPGLAALATDRFAHRGAPSLLIRSDLLVMVGVLPDGLSGPAEEYRMLLEPSEAAALGADIMVLFLVLGYQSDKIVADNAQALTRTVQRAHAIGLPVMVETVLWGSRVENQRDADLLAFACRFSAELGADVVKTQYTGDVSSMRDVVAATPVPVMALGGPMTGSPAELAAATREVLDSGARGVVYGRNIWQSADLAAAAAAVAAVVHPPAPVER